MQKKPQANINIKTLKKIVKENEDKLGEIKKNIPDFEDVLNNKRQLLVHELNLVGKILRVNVISLYLAPSVYEKAYEYYKIIHQCKDLDEHVGFMNKFGIHFTKQYDNFLLEGAKYCPYCGYKIPEQ